MKYYTKVSEQYMQTENLFGDVVDFYITKPTKIVIECATCLHVKVIMSEEPCHTCVNHDLWRPKT